MHKEIYQITANAQKLFQALEAQINRSVMPAVRGFGDAYYKMAERAYYQRHGTLPGGNSNARLKKKRRDCVLRWFNRQLSPNT